MKNIKSLITLFIIFVIFSSFSFSQEPKQTDFSEFKLTDIISTPDGTLFLSTDSAGIFKSTDDGKTWFLTSKITKNYTVNSMAYCDYLGLIAGTNNVKIIQSIDFGKSWRIRPHEYYKSSDSIESISIYKQKYALITISNGVPLILFDGIDARLGLITDQMNKIKKFYISEKGELFAIGTHIWKNLSVERWKTTWDTLDNAPNIFTNCMTSKNDILYIGTQSGIYISNNNGASWSLLSEDLTNDNITSLIHLDNSIIFAGTDSNGVLYSNDEGLNWNKMNIPNINSEIKRFIKCKNQNKLFFITQSNLLYSVNLSNFSLNSEKYSVILDADSIYTDYWMPFGDILDIDTKFEDKNSQINRIQLLNNDSLIYVSSKDKTKKLFISSTGKLYKKFQFPDSLKIINYEIKNTDSVLYYTYNKDQFLFGCYSIETGSSEKLFSVDVAYFRNFIQNYNGTGFSFLFIYPEKKEFLYVYEVKGIGAYGVPISLNGFEIRNINTGELKRQVKGKIVFSKDLKYYILDNFFVYDFDGNLIYDLRQKSEKIKNIPSKYYLQTCISPQNKYILLNLADDYIDYYHYIVDFKTGKIINEIPYDYVEYNYNFTYDDRFLVTVSATNLVKIYNVLSPEPAFDKLQWQDDFNKWQVSIAKNSNTIYLGSGNEERYYDNKNNTLILWTPDFSLTSVKDEEEFPKPEENALIFPNPAFDFINVVNTDENPWINPWIKEIKIFDIFGHILISVETQNFVSLQKINISTLPPGVYFVRIGNEKPIKFIKL